jgi:alpha-mannosidase
MRYRAILILLPCHSLEDFPTHHTGDNADALLANWTAAWHPSLLAAAGDMPRWKRIDDPPTEIEGRLILVPELSGNDLPTGFAQRAAEAGARLIRKKTSRAAILSEALAGIEVLPGEKGPEALDPERVQDFHALGYCFLLVQLLTRQMRYSSNLDETYFRDQVVAAAKALVEGRDDETKDRLQKCFDVLAEERDHYYPVDAFLIEVVMTADTALRESLRAELRRDDPRNLLLSGATLEKIAAEEPETFELLKAAVASDKLDLAGGDGEELPLPLLPPGAARYALAAGRETYERLLGRAPATYGRRRFGLGPALPGTLLDLGYKSALHIAFDEGKTPEGSQVKTGWEGQDGRSISAIARTPLQASLPETFLRLASKLGESMDADHVATLLFAHWPNQASPWMDDLRRAGKYTRALGTFVTLSDYFARTSEPGHVDRFDGERYSSPYFKQAIIRRRVDPLSSVASLWSRWIRLEGVSRLVALSAALVRTKPALAARVDLLRVKTLEAFAEAEKKQLARSVEEEVEIEVVPDEESNASLVPIQEGAEPKVEIDEPKAETLDADIEEIEREALQELSGSIIPAAADGRPGALLVQPFSYARRVGLLDAPLQGVPEVERPIYSAGEWNGKSQIVADVPSTGFVFATAGSGRSRGDNTPLAEEGVLRNEFFEALISPTSGSLTSLHVYEKRGNRMSQQLGLRLPTKKGKGANVRSDADDPADYSIMAMDEMEVTCASAVCGEIVTRGRLMGKTGDLHARFEQRYRAIRGSRTLQIDIDLDVRVEPKADPWNSHYAARFAWASEAADLFRNVGWQREKTRSKRIEAPLFLELDDASGSRTAILTGGLPYHRRQGFRMIDAILVCRGESRRSFRLGVCLDPPSTANEALSLLHDPLAIAANGKPRGPSHAWLLHVDARNVLVEAIDPVYENDRTIGWRLRLQETQGKASQPTLSCFLPIQDAWSAEDPEKRRSPISIDDGRVKFHMPPGRQMTLEVRF